MYIKRVYTKTTPCMRLSMEFLAAQFRVSVSSHICSTEYGVYDCHMLSTCCTTEQFLRGIYCSYSCHAVSLLLLRLDMRMHSTTDDIILQLKAETREISTFKFGYDGTKQKCFFEWIWRELWLCHSNRMWVRACDVRVYLFVKIVKKSSSPPT